MKPVAKARVRITRFGSYTPKETKEAQAWVKYSVMEALSKKRQLMLSGAVELNLVIQKLRPSSVPKKIMYPVVKPDVDNYAKLVMDACNGILWEDDNQVVTLRISKIYADTEGVFIGASSYV
jgi:Holliday junction resolvase RusA-like endonuclease